MDKNTLRQTIINALKLDLKNATRAADTARETATSKETVAENKYDTFSLEASYLAHGQSKRANELLQAIDCYQSLPFTAFTETTTISISALITLRTDDDSKKCYFLGPDAGGLKIIWNDIDIMIITPDTPLGRQLIGKQLDDTVELMIHNNITTYDIIAIE